MVLNVNNLTCHYNNYTAVNNVTFEASPKEILLIVGPNGAGKSTILHGIAGLIAYEGSIYLAGNDVRKESRKKQGKRIALLSQKTAVHFPYTVYETVLQGRYAHIESSIFANESKLDHQKVEECLQQTGMWIARERNIQTLSGGELQRVFLARAFAQEPELILLDEPTNHLDLTFQLELMTYLQKWVKKPGRMVVGVLHDLNLALSFGDKLLLLNEGKNLYCGNVEQLDWELLNRVYNMDVRSYMLKILKKWERK